MIRNRHLLAVSLFASAFPLFHNADKGADSPNGETKPAPKTDETPENPKPPENKETKPPETPAPKPPEKQTAKPGLSVQLKTLFSSSAESAKTIAQLQGNVSTLEQQLATANQTIATQLEELQSLRALRDEMQTHVDGLTAKQTTVEDTVAGLGFAQNKLPKNGSVETQSVSDLRIRIGQTTDPKEKNRLSQQIRKIQEDAKAGS